MIVSLKWTELGHAKTSCALESITTKTTSITWRFAYLLDDNNEPTMAIFECGNQQTPGIKKTLRMRKGIHKNNTADYYTHHEYDDRITN